MFVVCAHLGLLSRHVFTCDVAALKSEKYLMLVECTKLTEEEQGMIGCTDADNGTLCLSLTPAPDG
jgi:hypothetical protein